MPDDEPTEVDPPPPPKVEVRPDYEVVERLTASKPRPEPRANEDLVTWTPRGTSRPVARPDGPSLAATFAGRCPREEDSALAA